MWCVVPDTGIGKIKGISYESKHPRQNPKLDPQFSGIGRHPFAGIFAHHLWVKFRQSREITDGEISSIYRVILCSSHLSSLLRPQQDQYSQSFRYYQFF